MAKQNLDNAIRVDFINKLSEIISNELNMDVIPVSASAISVPTVDAEGNEKFVKISISVPHGTRDGNGGYIPYDGYKEGEAYAEELEANAAKKEKAEEKKRLKEEEKERKRALKAKAE